MNISYIKKGDYLLPNLILKEKVQFNIGKYGLIMLNYIKNNEKVLYSKLLMENDLNNFLYNLNNSVKEKVELLTNDIAIKECVNEKLKSMNQMEWVCKMNNVRNRAEEIVINDYIYEGQI